MRAARVQARFGGFHPFRIPQELGGNSGPELALTAEPTSPPACHRRGARAAAAAAPRRNHRPVADTIEPAARRDARARRLRPPAAGEQALANVLHVAELARQYEAGGGISFRGFIDELRTAAESEAAEAPILEESSDGVRLMTVHKAKGLEFPVVILADLTCRISRSDASRYVDGRRGLCALRPAGWAPHELHDHAADEVAREQAEGVRLAYVAATRARDSWSFRPWATSRGRVAGRSAQSRAVSPDVRAAHAVARARVSGVQVQGQRLAASARRASRRRDGVSRAAPFRRSRRGRRTGRPGRLGRRERRGKSRGRIRRRVVDPTALALEAIPPFGVRRADLVVKDVPKDVVAGGRSEYDRWALARLDAQGAGARVSLRVSTVRELATAMTGAARDEKASTPPFEPALDPTAVVIVDALAVAALPPWTTMPTAAVARRLAPWSTRYWHRRRSMPPATD